MAKKIRRSWPGMLSSMPGASERIGREYPEAAKLLDFLASRMEPYTGSGWTVFNDWLDECYRRGFFGRKRPAEIPFVPPDKMRDIVFPPRRN